MPALDYCHDNIVHALEKDGWTVSDKQFTVDTPDRTIHIDVEARRSANGTRQQILLAEVKCFPDRNSTTREIYIAFGQYIVYRAVLAEEEVNLPLYLAVPEAVYRTVFDAAIQRAIRDNQVKLIIVNIDTEAIIQWIQ